jgi:hypothetical protein
MIGVRVQRRDRTIYLNQERYVTDITKRFGQLDCRCISTPADNNVNLRDLEGSPLDISKYDYLSLIGSLMWATLTRPDIAAAVGGVAHNTLPILSKHTGKPQFEYYDT